MAIDVQTFVPSGGSVLIGGATPLVFQPGAVGLNVIQAAAPTGVSGIIAVSTPITDIAGSLRGLSTEVVSSAALGKDLCRVGASSSLTPLGRGGLRATATGMIRPEGQYSGIASAAASARRDTDDRWVTGLAQHNRCDY